MDPGAALDCGWGLSLSLSPAPLSRPGMREWALSAGLCLPGLGKEFASEPGIGLSLLKTLGLGWVSLLLL